MTTLNEIETLGFSLTNNICVFCSNILGNADRVCLNCNEYKGVMNIVEAVGYYGSDILPVWGKSHPRNGVSFWLLQLNMK